MALSAEIRPACRDDAPDLRSLIRAFRDSLGGPKPTDADLDHVLPALLEDPETEFLCARLQDRSVGYTQTRY